MVMWILSDDVRVILLVYYTLMQASRCDWSYARRTDKHLTRALYTQTGLTMTGLDISINHSVTGMANWFSALVK